MAEQTPQISRNVGVVAGGGVLPFAVADSLIARGVTPILFPLKGSCDAAAVLRFKHHWITPGSLGRLQRLARAEGCGDLIFIGSLVRPALSEMWLDWGAIKALPTVISAFRGGDNHLLKAVGRYFETGGFRILGLKEVAPDLLMPLGNLAHAQPDEATRADIAKGRAVLAALSPFDIGQGCVVIDGHVVAVEDTGGTDELLQRIVALRERGRIRARPGRGVLVKAPKAGQDLRFDLPAMGPRTIEGLAKAQLAGMAVVAGYTVVAEPQAIVEAADRAGLFVVGEP